MTDQKNIFTEMHDSLSGPRENTHREMNYHDPESFRKLVKARRSIRQFTDEKIPEFIVDECLDLALLAPNSSNLQTWSFYKIKNQNVKNELVKACFSQPAAATAAELIVCVANPKLWRKHCRQMLEALNTQSDKVPSSVQLYYGKLIPVLYTVGYLNVLTPFKWLFNSILGMFRPVPREPISSQGLSLWSVKSCALACENLMLAFRAHGYDTCPMEGFDAVRVKKILKLSRSEKIVMIISAGRRAEGGLYGDRLQFPREQFIKTI